MHDVRARALRSIAFKLDHHLVDVAQLVKVSIVLQVQSLQSIAYRLRPGRACCVSV